MSPSLDLFQHQFLCHGMEQPVADCELPSWPVWGGTRK